MMRVFVSISLTNALSVNFSTAAPDEVSMGGATERTTADKTSTDAFDLTIAQRTERLQAIVICTLLAGGASLAAVFGSGQGPAIHSLVPITATIWSLADLLTGFLLLAQFSVNGRTSFAILGINYAVCGLLTWAFLITFPGVVAPPTGTAGELDRFVYFWLLAHWIFPILTVVSVLVSDVRQAVVATQRSRMIATPLVLLIPLVVTAVIVVFIFRECNVLPYPVVGGRMQPIDHNVFQPAVMILNAAACVLLAARGKRLTSLQLWLCVAMTANCLDSLLITYGATVYSYAWDAGKFLAVVASSTVLIMALRGITKLYHRQFSMTEQLEADIAEQRSAQTQLREHNRLLAMAGDLAHVGHWRLELSSLALSWSSEMYRIHGLPTTHCPSFVSDFAAYHAEDREVVWQQLQTAIGEGRAFECDARIVHHDGSVRDVVVNGQAERGVAGNVVAVFGVTQDVTALKAAQRERDVLLRRSTVATRAARIGIWQWDVVSDTLIWDETMFRLFGRQETADMLTSAFYVQSLHAEDRDRIVVELATTSAAEIDQEFRILWGNGEIRHIHSIATVVRAADGTTARMTGAAWDITELRRLTQELLDDKQLLAAVNSKLDLSERRSRTLTDAMPQLVGILDSRKLLTYANRQWFHYTGTTPDAAAPLAPAELFHPDDTEAALASLSVLHLTPNVEFEVRVRQPDGAYRWHQARVVPLGDTLAGTEQWIVTFTDIQLRKAAEMVLREEHRLMSMAEELASIGHWRFDVINNTLFWSDEIYRTHGLAVSQPPSIEAALSAYHLNDSERVSDIVVQAIKSGEPFQFEARISRPDGTIRDVVSSGRAERGLDGRTAAIFGVLHDVTDLRAAELERTRLLERVTLATQIGNIGIWEFDFADGKLVWDAVMLALYEVEPGVQPTSEHWLSAVHPDDRERMVYENERAASGETSLDSEFRIVRKDGAVHHIRVMAKMICDAAGIPTRLVGTNWDITNVRRAEAALRASDQLFRQVEEHTPVGLALVGVDGTLLRVNRSLCELIGYESTELLRSNRESLTHPEDIARDRAATHELLSGSIPSYELEKRYIRKDGGIVWAYVCASVVRDDAGLPLYLIAQILDITARKLAEAERKAHSAAVAATDAKARFIATMSHEIRTPMNGVIGMTELLALSPLTDEQTEYVKVVRESGRSLLRIIDDILDFSKIENGKLDIDVQNFRLQSQLDSVVALVTPQFEEKGVALTTLVDPTVPDNLRGDPGRLRQVLINLVGNALKFTPAQGNVRILVTVEPPQDTLLIRFTVVDTGIGIAPEARHRLFQPFSQVDSSTSRKYGGTGLGLSICKQLVELMGGRLGVESIPGAGSSFSFVLPLVAEMPGEAGINAVEPIPADRRVRPRRRPERLLLAEDNQVNALLAIRQFERLGFDITVVGDGRQAVEALRQQPFDLVFMDCHMPGMDGFEATRAIRADEQHGKHTPIVAMTANAQAEDREQCLTAGMDDYISKPVSLAELDTLLDRMLRRAEPVAHSAPIGST